MAETLRNISDTTRFAALLRAQESERPDALFHDAYARELAVGDDPSLAGRVHSLRRRYHFDARTTAVRTRVIDDLICRAVREQGIETIISLAAGLDTRPYRLSLPPSLVWIDADLPGILSRKTEVLSGATPRCRLRTVAIDPSREDRRRELLDEIDATGQRVLVLTEGLLMQLSPEQVAGLAADLHRCRSVRFWLTDLRAAGEGVSFTPEDPQVFFHPFGWQPTRFYSLYLEARRFKRESPGDRCRRLIERLAPMNWRESWRRSCGVMVLRRVTD